MLFFLAMLLHFPSSCRASGEVQDLDFFEGDILGGIDHLSLLPRSTFGNDLHKWPGGIVAVEFNDNVIGNDLLVIKSVFEEFENSTCVRFRLKDVDEDYVHVQSSPGGCYSSLGRLGGRQIINLESPDCTSIRGTVVHEFMHTLGFLHEHTRSDRDEWVTILWENIQEGKEKNFDLVDEEINTHFGTPYDYYSVMQYNSYAFGKNPLLPTILPKTSDVMLVNNNHLSEGDIKRINLMYDCP